MWRTVESGFIAAIVVAVLGFGGTEPLFFSISQVILFALGILLSLLSTARNAHTPDGSRLPIVIPSLLLVLVLLQTVPFPPSLVQLAGSVGMGTGDASQNRISISSYETTTHLLLLLTYLVAFYLTLLICQARNGKRHLVLALLSLGLFEAFYGLVQYLTGWQRIFLHEKIFNLQAATGTYINRNHFAGFLEMVLPFALAFLFYHARGLWQDQAGSQAHAVDAADQPQFLKCVFWLSVAVFLFTALVFSRSRMGVVSALVSIMMMSGFILSSGRRRKTIIAIVACFLLAGILMAAWIGADPVISRFESLSSKGSANESQRRLGIWEDTVRLIENHPWLGTGLGTFPVAYTSVQTVHLAAFVNHAHNDYLEVTSELGLMGGILIFGIVLYVLGLAVRTFFTNPSQSHRAMALACTASLGALLMHSFTDFNLYLPANVLVLSTILGLAYSLGQEAPRPQEVAGERQ